MESPSSTNASEVGRGNVKALSHHVCFYSERFNTFVYIPRCVYAPGLTEVLIYIAIFVIGYILSGIVERLWSYVPSIITSPIESIWRIYLDFCRSLVPDYFYKLWLQTGIMEEEDYRILQERDVIDEDIDPTYIQENNGSR